MDRNWIEYEDGPRQPGPENIYVSINRVGDLMLNRFTFEALGKPEAVKLMYDPDTDVIGLRPVSRLMTCAFPLRPKGRSDNKRIRIKPFCERHDMRFDETVRFLQAEIENGILVLGLRNTRSTTRKKRSSGRRN